MDAMRDFMGTIDQEYDPNAPGASDDGPNELITIDNTLAPKGTTLTEKLMDRHWTFEEVLFIKGSSTSMSRQELQETVADAKGVLLTHVDVCFFDEDDLTHPLLSANMLAAGPPKGDVVCVWRAKYPPAAHKRYSRKWVKIKKKMETMPARWYLVSAIRKDGLLDDVRDQHLSAEEVIAEPVVLSLEDQRDATMWIPPAFDERNKLSLKDQLIKDKKDAEEAAEKKRVEEEEERAKRKTRNTKAAKNKRKIVKKKVEAIEGGEKKEEKQEKEGGMEDAAKAAAMEVAEAKT